MEKTLTVASLNELDKAASTILNDIGEHRVVALFGKMGAGKTTLIKAFCNHLGVDDVVSSPTFALVNEYLAQNGEPLFHFDFYRIESIEEVYDIGYEEYIYSGHFCFIEWPEMIMELLPESYVYLLIEETENGTRQISYRIPQ
jgi:tRNA threonylcarbamoyladenosine biosynthesis protein TsaE